MNDRMSVRVSLTLETMMHNGYLDGVEHMLREGEYRIQIVDASGYVVNTVRTRDVHIDLVHMDPCDACLHEHG